MAQELAEVHPEFTEKLRILKTQLCLCLSSVSKGVSPLIRKSQELAA